METKNEFNRNEATEKKRVAEKKNDVKSVGIMFGDVEVQVEAVFDNEKQTSILTGDALPTLRNNRFLGRGIPYTKNGKSVRYFRPDSFRYMATRRVSTSDEK